MKIRIVVKRPFGDIELEARSIDEVVESLKAFPEWLDIIDKLVLKAAPQEPSTETKEVLSGLVVFSNEGPLVTLPREKVTDKEAIGLILYALDFERLEPKEVGRLLELSGRPQLASAHD